MSNTQNTPETKEQRIVRIAKTMKKEYFQWLDNYKEYVKQQNKKGYQCQMCTYEAKFGEYYRNSSYINPFYRTYYRSNEPELYSIANEEVDIKKAAMKILYNEWTQKEEKARIERRVARRIEHVKSRMKENERVAKACGISVDTLLMIELKDAMYALSKENSSFLKKSDYDDDDWADWDD